MRRKRILQKVHNGILKGITVAASVLVILAAGCADTPGTKTPLIICICSLTWLSLFCYANSELRKVKRHEKSLR